MDRTYVRYWWSFFFRGIIAILFGLAAIIVPGITLDFLVLLVGAFFFVDGILSMVASFGTRRVEKRWWIALLEGIAGVAIGILTILWPQITLVAMILLIAGWALITGIFEIAAAFRLRKVISGEWFLGLSGVVSIVFGLLLLGRPGFGAVALVWVLGVYAILFGILLLFLGFKMRKFLRSDEGTLARSH